MYRNINIALGALILMLLSLAVILPVWRTTIGVSLRLMIAGFCFVTSAWMSRVRKAIILEGLLLVVGIGLIGTVLLGYSFNGIPPLSWLFR